VCSREYSSQSPRCSLCAASPASEAVKGTGRVRPSKRHICEDLRSGANRVWRSCVAVAARAVGVGRTGAHRKAGKERSKWCPQPSA